MVMIPSILDVTSKAAETTFGRPLITNVFRGHIVEAIVAYALEPVWRWCAEDYSAWDFERGDGLRLEVKQSAARQSWATTDKPSAGSFDIAERKGRWEGATWIESAGRAAAIYVFAHHPIADMTADHRDPMQWRFFVIPTNALPAKQRLSLTQARRLTDERTFQELSAAVHHVAESLQEFQD
jgi:hypothetical protein